MGTAVQFNLRNSNAGTIGDLFIGPSIYYTANQRDSFIGPGLEHLMHCGLVQLQTILTSAPVRAQRTGEVPFPGVPQQVVLQMALLLGPVLAEVASEGPLASVDAEVPLEIVR